MDRNLELAEMVVNKEIDLEEAKEITDDVDDLLEKIKLRRSMKYAMMAMIQWRQLKQVSTTIENRVQAVAYYNDILAQYTQLMAKVVSNKKADQKRKNDSISKRIDEFEANMASMTEEQKDATFELLQHDIHENQRQFQQSEAQIDKGFENLEAMRYRQMVGELQLKRLEPRMELLKTKYTCYTIASFMQMIGEAMQEIADTLLS